ncbi:MAG: hypothetical protein GX183_00035 [Firmicutes bacterium]|nr:hypothetical protein [Bacillota bacterium]
MGVSQRAVGMWEEEARVVSNRSTSNANIPSCFRMGRLAGAGQLFKPENLMVAGAASPGGRTSQTRTPKKRRRPPVTPRCRPGFHPHIPPFRGA